MLCINKKYGFGSLTFCSDSVTYDQSICVLQFDFTGT